MKKHLLIFIFFPFLTFAQTDSEKLEFIFKKIDTYEDDGNPMDSLWTGLHPKHAFYPINSKMYKKKGKALSKFIEELSSIQNEALGRQAYINKKIMLLRLNDQLSDIRFKMYLIPFNAEGGFYNNMSFALNRLPFKTQQDYEAYLGWLPHYAEWLNQHIGLLKLGIEEEIVAPKVIIQNTLKLLSTWTNPDPEKSPFYKPFTHIPSDISDEAQVVLQEKGKQVIFKKILPSYTFLRTFLQSNYLKASPEIPGVGNLPNGKAYYEDRIRFYTTFKITPDSVHNLGLQEVARIRKAMEQIVIDVGFKGNFGDFLQFLRTDERFYAKTPQELLRQAAWLSKKAEAGLPKLFDKLYRLPFTVAPVPDDIAPTYTGGRYVPGSWEQQRPGTYWVNTYQLESRPFYTLPSLTLHESVPGHHLQGALAQELKDMPYFRRNYYISAFGEGWGLYSEFLGEEMDMYTTPFEWFGRYTYEMWRACRLVVDTGIHYKGWSREKAVNYMASNTALSIHEVNTEIDRYIGWPGQAVSYKMGELKIKALRKNAEDVLKDKFDIRAFHNRILRNGSVPLSILEEEVENYISKAIVDEMLKEEQNK